MQCNVCSLICLAAYETLIHKLSGTVNALLVEYAAMVASVFIVITMLKMRLQGKKLLKIF